MSFKKTIKSIWKYTTLWMDAYFHILASKITSYKTNLSDRQLKPNEMLIGYNSIATLTSVRRYFRIVDVPKYLDENLFQFLRNQLASNIDTSVAVQEEELPEVHVNYRVNMKPHHINFSAKVMKDRKRLWDQAINESEAEIASDKSHFRNQSQDKVLERNKWLSESWTAFQRANESNMATPVIEIIIEIAVLRNDRYSTNIMDSCVRKLGDYCGTRSIVLEEIKGGLWNSLWEFMKMYPPVASDDLLTLPPDVPRRPVPTNVIPALMGIEQGTIRGSEIFLGLDMFTAKFVYKDAGVSGEAENILITGMTGSGKSNLCKSMTLNFSFNGYTVLALDRDGEYRQLVDAYKGHLIDFESGNYFDTFEIADLTGDLSIDGTLYNEAQAATMAIFNILCADPNCSAMTANEKSMFSDIVSEMDKNLGIDALNPNTWYKSKSEKYSYREFYRILCSRLQDPDYQRKYGHDHQLFVNKLSPYFSETGNQRGRFQHAISVNQIYELIDSNCPMIDFNLHLPESEQTPSAETLIKMISASHLMSIILSHNKARKQFTLCIVEELNRMLNNQQALEIASAMATGNRKKNAVSIFLSNTPAQFIDGDKNLQNIKANMNYLLFGRFTSGLDKMAEIAAAFDLKNSITHLERICTKDDHKYQFLLHDANYNDTTVIKAFNPPEYDYLFHTRDKKDVAS